MDKKQAGLILQLDKYSDVHEAYEDLLFGLKTLILNQLNLIFYFRLPKMLFMKKAYNLPA